MALTEQEFLANLARRLGRPTPATPPARVGHKRGDFKPAPGLETREARIEWFAQELTKLVGSIDRVESLEAAGEAVAAHIAKSCRPGGDVILWNEPVSLTAKAPLEKAGFTVAVWPQDKLRCANAVAGVTSVRYAIAETGSIAVGATPNTGRWVSLLPPLHVAMLPASVILPTLADYFKTLGTVPNLPSALNLISGPSRTADIELELAIGVHGPSNLHVIVYND